MTKIVVNLTQSVNNSMSLQVTNENDPVFLWVLDMSETDFHKMKAEQNILIDYQMFPSKYFELLEVCRHQSLGDINSSEFYGMQGISKFFLTLEQTSETNGDLKVVEVNNFRQICHINLRVAAATNEQLVRHLAAN